MPPAQDSNTSSRFFTVLYFTGIELLRRSDTHRTVPIDESIRDHSSTAQYMNSRLHYP
jgi:hypothetical protein